MGEPRTMDLLNPRVFKQFRYHDYQSLSCSDIRGLFQYYSAMRHFIIYGPLSKREGLNHQGLQTFKLPYLIVVSSKGQGHHGLGGKESWFPSLLGKLTICGSVHSHDDLKGKYCKVNLTSRTLGESVLRSTRHERTDRRWNGKIGQRVGGVKRTIETSDSGRRWGRETGGQRTGDYTTRPYEKVRVEEDGVDEESRE